MMFAAIGAAIVLAISVARIIFLGTEVETLESAGEELAKVIEPLEEKFPIDYTTAETIAASQEKMPAELQDEEAELAWANTATELKREGRTVWYGIAILALIAFVTAFIDLLRS